MAVALFRGQSSMCPCCGSRNVRLATRSEPPRMELVPLKALRVCEICGAVFEPRTSRSVCIAACLVALLSGLWIAIAFAAPSLGDLLAHGYRSLRAIGLCVLQVIAVAGLVQIAYVCARRAFH